MSTTALATDALVGRHAPDVAPPAPTRAPATTPRRRRIHGATTEPLPVRACSGEALGRRSGARPGTGRPVRRAEVIALHQAEPSTLRLTRRGRLLLTALSVIVFGGAVVVLGLRVTGVLEPGPTFDHTVPVQVAPGQTLWSIAQDTNPTQDPGTVVEKIADLNKLTSPADVTPGQTLQIPVAR